MLVRALLVVLIILNLGVALWWATQPQAAPVPAPPSPPPGVATLQLLDAGPAPAASAPAKPALPAVPLSPSVPASDTPASAAVASVPAASVAAATPPPAPAPAPTPTQPDAAAAPPVCLSVGPYPDRAAADAAAATLAADLPRARVREVGDSDATSFRVLLPTIGGEDGVKAAVERIVAAGIRDYYPIRQGEEAGAIALGQYRSREGAERRRAELAKAGFNVELIPSGGSGQPRWWLDLRVASAAQAGALRRQLGAARQRSLDCAALR
ncbi:SPOR domain-containing protein [Xanthomonas sp. AmX2]|uniref:SPOR domain-containing protein n=1 Tax=Xanthomonas sp. TaxID=29446 RepID=UPI00197F0DBF|nr:SPOR domain-containing protein [Xanthomonas sp.]MBN6152337.1 SPOR domain-containing protein [Xanthomonas sp.]